MPQDLRESLTLAEQVLLFVPLALAPTSTVFTWTYILNGILVSTLCPF